jgi:hypothetical protein
MAQLRIRYGKESQIALAQWSVAVEYRVVIYRYADGYYQGAMLTGGIVG